MMLFIKNNRYLSLYNSFIWCKNYTERQYKGEKGK